MAEVIKTIRGRQYRYLNESKRVNGKVVTKSRYLGPVHPKRKRGPGVLGQLLGGGLSIAAHAVKGTLPPPGGVTYSVTGQIGDRRSWEPERSVEAIQAKARVAATPDNKPVDLELLDMVREFEAHLKASVENKGDGKASEDGKQADVGESEGGKDGVGVEVDVGDGQGDGEPL